MANQEINYTLFFYNTMDWMDSYCYKDWKVQSSTNLKNTSPQVQKDSINEISSATSNQSWGRISFDVGKM